MGGGQIVHTVCMQTKDAIQRKEGEITMRLGGDNPRFNPVKVALGSLEFPIVQWSIEEEWCRFYFSEGYRIEKQTSWLRLEERADGMGQTTQIHLPLYLNEIIEWRFMGQWVVVKCKDTHNLWMHATHCVVQGVDWGDVEIICAPMGRISISALFQQNKLRYMSEHEFMIYYDAIEEFEEKYGSGCGYLHLPTIPSPTSLCQFITFLLRRSNTLVVKKMEYNASYNKAHLVMEHFAEASVIHLRLHGSHLAQLLGYRSSLHERIFRAKPSKELGIEESSTPNFFTKEYDTPPLYLPSEQMGGWEYVKIQPGWYAPQHRPMTTGQPLRLPSEIELALNRLYFQIPERIPSGSATAHFLVFQDPCGETHHCPVFAGRYSPHTFARYLEVEMMRQCKSSSPDTLFTVDYNPADEFFTFSCEIKIDDKTVTPAPFSMMLNHPAQFDPAKIGFEPVPLNGSSSYTSTLKVVFPHFETPRQLDDSLEVRWHSNLYRISDVAHQKIFRIHAAPPPAISGVIKGYNSEKCELRVATYVGQLPFAHNLQAYSIVRLGTSRSIEVFALQDGEWVEVAYSSCPVAPRWGRTAIVLPPSDTDASPLELRLKVRSTPRLKECIDQVLQIQPQLAPFNLCFGTLPQSIPHTSLGFKQGAVQWGIDGSVSANGVLIPPFDAPFVHSLDHPDYILLYLVEGKKATTLQHSSGTQNTAPFAKLVLYPLFREERMLPRDTTLLSGESLSVFTLRFCNPDGSLYHFHGAEFSFSLNFITVHD